MIPFIKTEDNLTLFWNGKTKIVPVGTPAYDEVMRLLKQCPLPPDEKIFAAGDLLDQVKLKCHSSNLFSVDEDGNVWVGCEKVANSLSDRIIDFAEQGLPFQPLISFWNNCVANPDARARTDLFSFLEHNGHPITEDGCFIAYRKVNSDFKDFRTQSMDNRVGQTVKMDREACNSDPNQTCSAGLHVASLHYAANCHSAGGYVVCVKVNPRNVVAIPTDYNQEKMRCCEFNVLSVYDSERPISAPLVDDTCQPKTRNDYVTPMDSEWDAPITNEANEWQDLSDYEHQLALDREKAQKADTKNRGWQNLRDSKGRFYKKRGKSKASLVTLRSLK